MIRHLATFAGALVVAALALAPVAGAAGEQATGSLVDGAGNIIGQVQLAQQADNSVRLALTLKDASVVKPGQHGIHFHAVGTCDGPDFATAGAHFNPAGKLHGAKNPQGPHAGDLPNLAIDPATATAQGGYAATLTTAMVTLAAGPTGLFDADGTTLVIHANPDDEATDPSGNSGGRLACAVLRQVSPGALPNTGGGAAAARRDLERRVVLLAIATLATTMLAAGLARRRPV